MRAWSRWLTLGLSVFASAAAPLAAQTIALPMKSGSVRFLVFGDAGTGGVEQ